jgi:3-hydroxybutyryl-CoA dehydrogenase
MKKIQSVLIYGYGVMGRGVAKTFASHGFDVTVRTARAATVTDLPDGVRAVATLPARAPDLIIELVPEDVPTKQKVFAEVETAYAGQDYLLGTGTSGLDLVELAKTLKSPEKFLGIHYFMPAETAPVVEVMGGPASSRESVDVTVEAIQRSGKETVVLYKPIVGFLVNRLQHAILSEAYYLIENGIADAAAIDHAARRLLAPRMCLNGLIQQKDISGLKIHAEAQASIVPELFHTGIANPMLQAMAQRGEIGLAAGKGFYDWTGCDTNAVRKQASVQLSALLHYIDNELPKSAPGTEPRPRDPRKPG